MDLDWDFEAKKIVAVGEGGQFLAKCFTWDTGNSVGEMVGHNKKILTCAFRKTRPFKIMTGSEDFGTVFFAGPPFKLDHSNNVHTNFVQCVRYSPDGNRIISVGSDRKVQLYDGTTGQPNGEILDAHAGSVYSVCFSPDGSKFLTAGGDKTVKLWDLATLACESTFNMSADPQVGDMQVAVAWTETHMLSLSLNGNINVLNAGTPLPVGKYESHQAAINSLCVDPLSNLLYTGSIDGVVCVRNIESGESVKVVSQDKKNVAGGAHGGKVSGIAVTGDMVVSVGWDDSVRFADPNSKSYVYSSGLTGQPCAIASSSVPGVFAVVTNSEICLYRGRDRVATLTGVAYVPTCASLCGDNELAVGGDDSKTHIYKISGGGFTEVTNIPTRSPVSSLAYSPNNDVLAIGDNGRQVEVYERGTWNAKIQGKWVFHTSKITCLSWSPTGSHLASGSLDESIFIWDLATPSKKVQFQFAHMGGVTCVGWANSNQLFSGGNDNTVVHWKVPVE
jgi:WD40 repeat protein